MTAASDPATRELRGVTVPALLVAVAAFAALLVVIEVALGTSWGQSADDRAMASAVAGREARLTLLSILGRVPVVAVAAVAVVGVLLALVRRHLRVALGAGVAIAGANLTTQVLKQVVLDRPDLGLGVHNSLPSGHVTVAASTTAALLMVVGTRIRVFLAGLGAFAVGLTGLSTIVAGWHRPGDVVAALLVSLGWGAVGVVVAGGRRAPSRGALLTALSGAVSALLAIVLIGVRPVSGLDGFFEASAVLGAVAVASAVTVWLMTAICPADP